VQALNGLGDIIKAMVTRGGGKIVTGLPESKRVTVSSLDLHYWDWGGGGPPLILLHPSTGFGRIWDFVAEQLRDSYHIYAPDQRFHGDSGRPSSGYAGEDFTADLEAFLDHLGLEKVVLVGHLLGSRVGTIYAGRHPARVNYLVLLAPSFYYRPEFVAGAVELVWQCRMFYDSPAEVLAAFRTAATAGADITAGKIVGDFYISTLAQDSEAVWQHVITHNMRYGAEGSVEWKWDQKGIAEGLSHICDDISSYVRRVQCPVLIIRSQGNQELSYERALEMKNSFQRANLAEVSGTLYMPQLENPAEVARLIREALVAPLE
jgi:2-(acetamidomethylene)succinate hydrolase